MIPCILMTWESGENTYGNFCSRYCKIWEWREHLPNCRPFLLPGSYWSWLMTSFYYARMGAFPRWNGLKHFYNVTTIKFTDGQSFYDILKVSFFITCAAEAKLKCLIAEVYSSMYCWFASQRFRTCPLHSCIPMLSNPYWLALHDWEPHKTA